MNPLIPSASLKHPSVLQIDPPKRDNNRRWINVHLHRSDVKTVTTEDAKDNHGNSADN